MSAKFAIVTHGGAGLWKIEEAPALLPGMEAATRAGLDILSAGGSAVDAVAAVVAALEDNPLFNAGTGSALNLAGEIEMDAAVMAGEGLRCGSVGALRGVRNPILVARKVMEKTDHVLLAGEGAQRFAREMGFADHDGRTPKRLADYRQQLAELRQGQSDGFPRLPELLARHPSLSGGTVGAVARDASGGLAAATSTGGITLKLPGRIGDSAIPGAGNYATPRAAASATGHGETIMRYLATKVLCDLIGSGCAVQEATEKILGLMRGEQRGAGVIAVDVQGEIGVAHNTPYMPHAFFIEGRDRIVARMRV